ncbi:MAG: acyl-CoA dehydrogenase family protein [Gemmatimonadetes bacterium]|nr:acyl-CoA dehydrogenase family protein [Gemmatimonadota bacterium]
MQDTVVQEIRDLARDFAAGSLRPNVERWDHDASIDRETLDSLAGLGFHGMLIPERHGGLGLGLPAWVAAVEALAWGEPAVALAVTARASVATALLEAGSDALRTRWLEELAAGAAAWVPLAADEAVEAVRAGAEWQLHGTLRWVLRAGESGCMLVPARTRGAAGTQQTAGRDTLFVIATDARGVDTSRERTLGLRPAVIGPIRFTNVHAGGDALVAQGAPLEVAAARIAAVDRLGIAAVAAGIARAALEHATAYAAQREQFQRQLREFEGIQIKLADMATRSEAAAALLRHAAGAPEPGLIAMAKLFASETAMWVSTQAVQIFGGYGYMRDYPVEKLMRDAKATEMFTGTNEDLRVLIAAELYRS